MNDSRRDAMNRPIIGITPYTKEDGSIYLPDGYVKGIKDIDCEMLVIDYRNFTIRALREAADKVDGMLFSGGKDVSPRFYGEEAVPEAGPFCLERDELELLLFEILRAKKKPMLGICRGQQIVNVAAGGTLYQHVPAVFGKNHQQGSDDPPFVHEISIVPGTKTHKMFGETHIMVDSYHHQSVKDVAEGFIVTARSPEGVVEAIESTVDDFIVCLQWHPEKTLGLDEHSMKPFYEFKKAITRRMCVR